ncbi:MAG TPA: UDP-N-acetylglucosamine 2-epimerase (non-hydrolyzing), partial [Thermoanaerobacter sp.]|nr:UDP-N-acetylglucosamine 2-epimerase (non-hydrolyzing) [Thermoanaerobacter sp.]
VLFRSEMPTPDYNLGVGPGRHGEPPRRMLMAIEEVLLREKPDWVLLSGDPTSTLAGALAAVKLHIPVAHVEAGLRSFNRKMPEEINRILTDHSSDLLFAPTKTAVDNLRREGIPDERIHLVGDVMYDAALFYGKKARRECRILERLKLKSKEYILATVHRAENTDDPEKLKAIIKGLCKVAKEVPVILPLHPRTRKALETYKLIEEAGAYLKLIEPIGYLDMVMLEQNARLIATDSGGVQKEAFFYRVPCVTLRTETEWVELVDAGWNRLCPTVDETMVYQTILKTIQSPMESPNAKEFFIKDKAAELIVRILRR